METATLTGTAQLRRETLKECRARGELYDPDTGRPYEFRGACKTFYQSDAPQIILSGMADSAKTFTACLKLHRIAQSNPNANCAIVRKSYVSLHGSVLQTYERLIADLGISAYGGEKAQWYDYPNGSRIWVGGMDNPEKVLSSERDCIYCNQAEELDLHDWEVLSTRTTGRGAVVKHAQIFGDCNPGSSRHWIKELAKSGTLDLLVATHKDNPTIYDTAGNLTDKGRLRLAALEKLSGIRRKRLFEGLWISAEGVVYDMFNSQPGGPHVRARDPCEMVRWFCAMDEGYTNPQVNLLIGADSDNRWHVFKEFYVTHHLESEVVEQCRGWWDDVRSALGKFTEGRVGIELVAVDEAAAGLIAALRSAGINAVGGKGLIGGNGKVKGGIDKIQDRLKVQADGKARLTVDPQCTETINEFESYVWKPEKDVPVDADNHAMGCLRYLEDAIGESTAIREPDRIRFGSVRNIPRFVPRRLI